MNFLFLFQGQLKVEVMIHETVITCHHRSCIPCHIKGDAWEQSLHQPSLPIYEIGGDKRILPTQVQSLN